LALFVTLVPFQCAVLTTGSAALWVERFDEILSYRPMAADCLLQAGSAQALE
jgi:hypothetical protein